LFHITALVLVVLVLGACAQRGQVPVSGLGEDDDTFCRANGIKVGSTEYVPCRKDRDVMRGNAVARSDRAQRDLGEYMLDHPAR